jgi:hypothetical protein
MSKEEQSPEGEEGLDMEIHQGESKSIARQEALKHIKKQHPQRDVPRVDEDQLPPEGEAGGEAP